MAEKFVSHGNSFNGDGTSSGEATIDGGVGAWNSIWEVLCDGVTYGSIDPGDIVYIRTAIDGVDITATLTATKSWNFVGVVNNPVFFIADDGTKWPGDGGRLTIEISPSYNLGDDHGLQYSWYIFGDKNNPRVRFLDTSTGSHNQDFVQLEGGQGTIIEGLETDVVLADSIGVICEMNCAGNVTLNNGVFKHFRRRYNSAGYGNFNLGTTTIVRINGSDFVATDGCDPSSGGMSASGRYTNFVHFRGCNAIDFPAGDTVMQPFNDDETSYSSRKTLYSTCNWGLCRLDLVDEGLGHLGYSVDFINMNGGLNIKKMSSQGYVEWFSAKNYPTLNSTLPSLSSWALKVTPSKYLSLVNPWLASSLKKIWNRTSSRLNVVVNLAIKDTQGGSGAFDEVLKKHYYVCVSYVSAVDGRVKSEFSPMNDEPLEVSASTWLPILGGRIAYGENSYSPFKIELATSELVKENSVVMVAVYITQPQVASADYNFMDPDPQLEAI